jgi:hypothetical protein
MVAGCGKKKSPAVAKTTQTSRFQQLAAAPPPFAPSEQDESAAYRDGSPEGKERFAKEQKSLAQRFSGKLDDADPNVRKQAVEGLAQAGEEGYSELKKGLENPEATVRRVALMGLTMPVVQKHESEVVPLLLKLLNDRDLNVRRQVCIILTWPDKILGKDEIKAGSTALDRMAALREVAQKDADLSIRNLARSNVERIQQIVEGKLVLGGKGMPDGKAIPEKPSLSDELRTDTKLIRRAGEKEMKDYGLPPRRVVPTERPN